MKIIKVLHQSNRFPHLNPNGKFHNTFTIFSPSNTTFVLFRCDYVLRNWIVHVIQRLEKILLYIISRIKSCLSTMNRINFIYIMRRAFPPKYAPNKQAENIEKKYAIRQWTISVLKIKRKCKIECAFFSLVFSLCSIKWWKLENWFIFHISLNLVLTILKIIILFIKAIQI